MKVITDMEMRLAIGELTDEERENLIQELWVSHTVFNNWLTEKAAMGSKKRNKLIHLLGL